MACFVTNICIMLFFICVFTNAFPLIFTYHTFQSLNCLCLITEKGRLDPITFLFVVFRVIWVTGNFYSQIIQSLRQLLQVLITMLVNISKAIFRSKKFPVTCVCAYTYEIYISHSSFESVQNFIPSTFAESLLLQLSKIACFIYFQNPFHLNRFP